MTGLGRLPDVILHDISGDGLLKRFGGHQRPTTLRKKYRGRPKQRRGEVRVVEGDGPIVEGVGHVTVMSWMCLEKSTMR